MPNDAPLFADFSEPCRALAQALRPLLERHGAEFYRVNIQRQVRVGWTGGPRHRLLGTLQCQRNGLRLSLRAGHHSRFMGDGMLQQDRTRPDAGSVLLHGDVIPAWLRDAIDDAFRFARD